MLLTKTIMFEKALIECVEIYLNTLKQMTISPPITLMVSLLRVTGYTMAVSHSLDAWHDNVFPIDRDTLIVPETIFESYPPDIARALRPTFDAVWNATGWPNSRSYDDQGEWGKGPNCR